ncbi:nucleoside-triphosphatase [Methanoculleus sp. 7T]|uniref:nucleoside-triphosphatase n=1 Tax=Methanoculleus sp. 7T TaxID=2937282 RepID=UPI0020BFB881|nr:nucleoside-triphosphatase [Methanoculleus sp. 7T]MCK8518501.1 nucleotide kinase [Methanoculleus sp. 7T]
MSDQTPVFIITGEQGQCKTTFLHLVLGLTVGLNVRVRGVLAPGHVRNGRRSGFTLVDLATGEHEELCSIDPDLRCEVHGRFYFRSEGLAFGRRALAPPDPRETDLVVIDEVGRFELQGAVWADQIDRLLALPHPPMIWTVRRRLLDTVIQRWTIGNPIVVDVRNASVMATASDVMDAVWEWREAQAVSVVPVPPLPQSRITGDPPLLADAAAGVSPSAPAILRRRYGPEG